MKKIIPALFVLGIFISPNNAKAQVKDTSLTKNIWHDYDGTLGTHPIQMSFYLFSNDSIKGNYAYKKNAQKIAIIGKMVKGQVIATEMVDGNPNGYFKSVKWQTYSSNICEGTWTNADNTKSYEFKLSPLGESGTSYLHRYPDVSSDAILENFMKKVKFSVAAGNKVWLADNISYPITVHTYDTAGTSTGTLKIKDKESFLKNYSAIFTAAFKEKLLYDMPFDLFGNYLGYMLGNGDIWVTVGSNKDTLQISAINN